MQQVGLANHELKDRHIDRPFQKLNEREYLHIGDASQILGLAKRSIYNLIYRGELRAAKLTTRLTIIRKDDIERMLSNGSYTKNPKPKHEDITEFYTIQEIKDKYGVSTSWIYKVGKEKNIPRIIKRGKTYWSKTHIDKFIISNKADDSITEWYSVSDLMEKFNMTQSAVYSFIYERNIPKKKVKNEVFYSKKHVDIAKGIAEPERVEYYSTAEAMEKYHITKDQLFYYIKTFNLPKIKEGKYVKIAKKELDKVFSDPVIKLQ